MNPGDRQCRRAATHDLVAKRTKLAKAAKKLLADIFAIFASFALIAMNS